MGFEFEKEQDERDQASPSWMKQVREQLDGVANPHTQGDACTAAFDDPCKVSKDVIAGQFAFLGVQSCNALDALQDDLEAIDKPNWQEALLEHCLDVALTVGGARVGEFIVEKAGHEFAKHAKTAAEFVKKAIEEGAPKGTKAAMAVLRGNSSPDVKEFISAQKVGVVAMYEQAQISFVESGRDSLKTKNDAAAFQRALDPVHVIASAGRQYVASRDAYLSCLAKQTLGTTKTGTTAMDGSGSGHAADLAGAMFGIDKGVLVAEILVYDDVRREPGVWGSYLNGINDKIREQYEDTQLSSMRIPRQLRCSVRGDMQDFVVNVDETGAMDLVAGDGSWLEARARAERPEVANKSRAEQRRVGLDLLLSSLRIEKVGRGGT